MREEGEDEGRGSYWWSSSAPGELFRDHFWLITDWPEEERPGAGLLEHCRRRGKAEGHMGEWMSTSNPRLSSTHRWKDHYQGRDILSPVVLGHLLGQNGVLLVLSALAYSLMHGLRSLVTRERGEPWSIRRLRERVLRVATRFLIHARIVTVVISANAARYWRPILAHMECLPRLKAQLV